MLLPVAPTNFAPKTNVNMDFLVRENFIATYWIKMAGAILAGQILAPILSKRRAALCITRQPPFLVVGEVLQQVEGKGTQPYVPQ